MTHYDILGISCTAIDTEIKKAYHQMIIAFHPDKYQGDKQFAAKKTHELIEAYKVLRNPITRKHYDDQLNPPVRSTTEKKRKNKSTSAAGCQPRKNEDTNRSASSHSERTKPKGVSKFIVALSIIGILFVLFVVALFVMIILNIYAPRRWIL